jgi:hypothetical protein
MSETMKLLSTKYTDLLLEIRLASYLDQQQALKLLDKRPFEFTVDFGL